jgi:L-fuconolactonase
MDRIDSHQHFWHFDPVRDSWIDDEMKEIRRDFLPQDLAPILKENNIDGCVAVQADQSEAQNAFLLDLAASNYFIKGIVGWVDLRASNVEERLGYYKQYSAMKGFRHVLQGEANRSLMLTDEFKRGIELLEGFGYTYDILIFPDQLKFTEEFVGAFPHQRFVIDHIAKPPIKAGRIDEWEKDIRAVASHYNVCCKVSGMVTEADYKGWKAEDFTPYLDVVFDAFGPSRLMYGSDWPVCQVAGGYQKMIGLVQDYTAKLSEHEQKLFWGENAIKFYNLTN